MKHSGWGFHFRTDISEREYSLIGVVQSAGATNCAFCRNAGYRGMYDMDLGKICTLKGVPNSRSPLDFMGKQELAANLFRLTETEAKIKNRNVRGQRALENTAEQVGRKVRRTMLEISGTCPELLAPAEDIKKVPRWKRSAIIKRTRVAALHQWLDVG